MTDSTKTGRQELHGQGALVTGGGGGFGRVLAQRLAADGAAVTLMGRTEERLRSVANDIATKLPEAPAVQWFVGDAMVEEDVVGAVALADATPLRIVVATVGGGTVRPVLMLDEETLEFDFRRNVLSSLLTIRHGAVVMARHGGGSIICISSSAGGHSLPFMPAYSVAKAALEALVRVSADELGHLGIRVNAVRPGLVPTDASKPGMLVADEEQLTSVLRETPISRLGTATDIASAVRYLAGPESAWVTGISLPVEGGSHLRRAPELEKLARSICGDEAIDQALNGEIPT